MTELTNRNECNIKITLKHIKYREKTAMLNWKGTKTFSKSKQIKQ